MNSFRKLGNWEEAVFTFKGFGENSQNTLGSTRKYRKGAREIWALFSGSNGALTPPPSPLPPPREGSHIRDLSVGIDIILLKIVNGVYI